MKTQSKHAAPQYGLVIVRDLQELNRKTVNLRSTVNPRMIVIESFVLRQMGVFNCIIFTVGNAMTSEKIGEVGTWNFEGEACLWTRYIFFRKVAEEVSVGIGMPVRSLQK
jgi:hypothetical protein